MMGIESLNKAALAAGFAMATPDDDPPLEMRHHVRDEHTEPAGHWRPFIGAVHKRIGARDTVLGAVGWLKDRLPIMGGRAPA